MYTKNDILKGIQEIGILPTDTLLIHSSMKSIGPVENGADTVIDAFMEYMKEGLLIFPTHTWEQMSEKYNIFRPKTEPSCVGLLTNIFRQRPGVVRSLHPTHSVAAYGADALEYIHGEENWETPCPRKGCWGRLYDRKAKILFLGCSLKRNTFLHSVEEWNQIPNRLAEVPKPLKIELQDGTLIDRPLRGHQSTVGDVSQNYDKMLEPFLHYGIAKKGRIGDAECVLCDAVGMAELTTEFLKKNTMLFDNGEPVPKEWYYNV
ncbi:MAG: AAC(3) family N-acetyltransferase [Clostridiales bacterium]|jgi:aminoglycoside 3-N-acetyltransferase|nr:AAC(3) family N-acetyltransferase [Clostridiales bacterium]